ncbi:MAG: M43 family zinc metalloprotease [Bacteroidetes bacterium]|nr:M43 family zinc metalloprotease [Bacteroidota bacterium]
MNKMATLRTWVFVCFIMAFQCNKSWAQGSENNSGKDHDIRCGTMDAYNKHVAEDPSVEQRRIEFEQNLSLWMANHPGEATDVNVTIPVVVHIVFNTTAQNVTDQSVYEQIQVLNTDYSGANPHPMYSFSNSLKVNTDIQFCLAKKKPDGTPSNGIERRYTTVTEFPNDNSVKHYSTGGLDAWDPTQYMNIWVCNLVGWLGYAQYPWEGINSTYGMIVKYTAWGLTGSLPPYNLGGTATHELGHCLSLLHIWGDEPACTGSDYCGDTPNQADYTSGYHTGLLTDACSPSSPGIMYMNFMDYSDDLNYANFTPNQKSRIQSCFTSTGYLYSLISSDVCTPLTSQLYSDAAVSTGTTPSWYLFNNDYPHWCVVAVRPNVTGDDWNLGLYADDGFNLPTIAGSGNGSSVPVDFIVVDNNHAPLQNRGIRMNRYSGSGSGTIEFEGFNETLTTGNNAGISWPAGDVAEMWDIYLTPGTYRFNLNVNSGTANLGLALYGSTTGDYYQGRNNFIALSDANGNGLNETIDVTITVPDWYGLCVFCSNAFSASFDLNIGEPGQWLGLVSSDWDNEDNWGAGEIPDAGMDVTINAGTPYPPIIGDGVEAFCRDLVLGSGATLTQNAVSYFNVYGDFNSDLGTFTMNGASYLYFTGTQDNYWDDDNMNDTYTYVRVDKSNPTAETSMWQSMIVSGTFEVREGVFSIDGTWTLTVTHTGTQAFYIQDGGKLVLNNETIHVAGGIRFDNGSQATINGGIIYCGGNFRVDANASYNIVFTGGELILDGSGTQYIQDLDAGFLQLFDLTINKPSGTCYLANNSLNISHNLLINSGTLSCNNGYPSTVTFNIYIGGNWNNNVGTSGFEESNSIVWFNGSAGHQYCSSETFYILNVNKSAGAFRVNGGTVTCNTYDWTAGAVDVLSGHFIANSLADNGIAGNFYLNSGGQIDLTNTTGYVDLNGNLYISGGTFNVHGGTYMSYWPYSSNASVNLSGGILDFKDQGIQIDNNSYTFTENITGGVIRTAGSVYSYRNNIHLDAGTFELYGPAQAHIYTVTGFSFFNLNINKETIYSLFPQPLNPYLNLSRTEGLMADAPSGPEDTPSANNVIASTNLDINGDFTITSGIFDAPDIMYVAGNWTNSEGDAGFLEGNGSVIFDGPDAADITTNETFYNLTLNKTYISYDGLEFSTNVHLLGDLSIADGTLEINNNAVLDVDGNIHISADAGLNANDGPSVQIFCGWDWTDENNSFDSYKGFCAGIYSVVTFDASTVEDDQVIIELNPFNNIIINSGANNVRPDLFYYIITCYNMTITSGQLFVRFGRINISNNLDIYGSVKMIYLPDSVVVGNNIYWRPGSNDSITNGKIFCGGDWTFYNGTNAILGSGNKVIFNQNNPSYIRCDDPNAAFGELQISKPGGAASETFIHGSSTDTIRVNGDMTVFPGNLFHVQSKNLIVDGILDIQNTAEMDLTTGYVLNNSSAFSLPGWLSVANGQVLVHGTFELETTGRLYIAGGSFTSDAPQVLPSWQYIRGAFKLTDGVFEIANNSIYITSTVVDSISGGTIICGLAFAAINSGTFEPSGGKVKCTNMVPSTTAYIFCSGGNFFHNLEISGRNGIQTDINVKNDVLISDGYLSAETYDIYVGGNWTNLVGASGFYEYVQKVVFNGSENHFRQGRQPLAIITTGLRANWMSAEVHLLPMT